MDKNDVIAIAMLGIVEPKFKFSRWIGEIGEMIK